MLTKQRKPFNTSTKMLPLNDSVARQYDTLMKSRSSKIMSQEELDKMFTQFYNKNEKWQAKKEKMRQEKKILNEQNEMKGCTFNPSINPEKQEFMTAGSGSFLKRQNDWMSKKEKKIKELQTESEKKKTKECSFHPKISKKSYSLLFNNKRSDKKTEIASIQEVKGLSSSRLIASSYRVIHEKKDSYRQLRKSEGFKLMTEKRYLQRLQHQTLHKPPTTTETHSIHDSVQQQFSFSSVNLPFTPHKSPQPTYDDYIENIVIKTQEQDTFNSFSSMEMRSDRKPENEGIQNQIFEEQVEEESLGQVQVEQEEENDELLSYHDDEEYDYDGQNDDENGSYEDQQPVSHQEHEEIQPQHQNATKLSNELNDLQLQNENHQEKSI